MVRPPSRPHNSRDKQSDYAPADAGITLEALEFLHGDAGRHLRAAVAALTDPAAPAVADVARLRKEYPAEMLRAALVMGAIQKKGRDKFPELPYVWSPPEALEQATSSRVARHKAARFAAAREGAASLFDFCSGIGGDALALADVAPVTAVDLSGVRLACLRYNAAQREPARQFAIETRAADVAGVISELPAEALVHIDPARRSAGKRTPQYADMQPGPAVLDAAIGRAAGMAIKLSPAVDFDSLPAGHLELITEIDTVVQGVLWTGRLATAGATERTATVMSRSGDAWSFTATPFAAVIGGLPRVSGELPTPLCLYEVDGALTRAGLAGPFCVRHALEALTPDGGYAISARFDLADPALAAFAVVGIHPFSERRVAEALQQLPAEAGPSAVEVKTRGGLPGVDTDHLQVAWSRVSRGRWTVLVFRHGKEVYAAIARRLPTSPPSTPHRPSE